MYICEEYMKRHNVKIPVVKHAPFTSLVYKKNNCSWKILRIHWEDDTVRNATGRYKINICQVVRNGYFLNQFIEIENAFSSDLSLAWDQYENFILTWASSLDLHIPKSRKELFLAGWEMFICCLDEWISHQGLQDKIFSTIDLESSLDNRYLALQEELFWLSKTNPDIYKFWKSSMSDYIVPHSEWLSDIIIQNAVSCPN